MVTKGTDLNLNEMATAFKNDEEEDDEDDRQHDDKSGEESEEEADGFVTDIHVSVQCMMDLIPSMEQVLQQKNSTAPLFEEERGRRL